MSARIRQQECVFPARQADQHLACFTATIRRQHAGATARVTEWDGDSHRKISEISEIRICAWQKCCANLCHKTDIS